MTPRGHVTPPCRAFGSLCQKKWKKRGVKSREKRKEVAYRAPAALCCWLFDVAILSLTLLCIAPFLKEASVQATSAFTFYYMFRSTVITVQRHAMKKANTITLSQDSFTLLSFHPRPPNEPPLPDHTAVKLNMVTIKAGAKKPGAKTQKLCQSCGRADLSWSRRRPLPRLTRPDGQWK